MADLGAETAVRSNDTGPLAASLDGSLSRTLTVDTAGAEQTAWSSLPPEHESEHEHEHRNARASAASVYSLEKGEMRDPARP